MLEVYPTIANIKKINPNIKILYRKLEQYINISIYSLEDLISMLNSRKEEFINGQ